jgi:quinol monooxygenase YgiN
MYCRMVIGEAISSDQARQFQSMFMQEIRSEILKEEGNLGVDFMVEDAGNMVIVLTRWDSRESCLKYHASRAYRQLVTKTQHLLVGDFVVKLFRID